MAIFIIAVVAFSAGFCRRLARRRVGHNEKSYHYHAGRRHRGGGRHPVWLVVIAAAMLRIYPIPSIS
ncbi:hypothetical protein LNP74_23925 [Klebsiella pneumoniae subsp. pneumoniae]|nr:hypothetical protein [Klebsiella pneumoniae subsp. pneumoniae]